MLFWPGTSRETNSSPRRATFRWKNTRGSLCKHWRPRPSLANHLAWSKCMAKSSFPFKTSSMSWGLASAKLHVSQISAVDRKLFIQTFWEAALGSKANPTEMLTTAQHKLTSAIIGAERQRSVQKWRSSPTSNTLMLNTCYTSRSLWERHWGSAGSQTSPQSSTRQDPTAYSSWETRVADVTSASSLQVEAA